MDKLNLNFIVNQLRVLDVTEHTITKVDIDTDKLMMLESFVLNELFVNLDYGCE